MPSLTVIIIVLATAGIMIMVGTVITVRRYFDSQDQRVVSAGRTWKDVLSCVYCDHLTDEYIHLTQDGANYMPVCFYCQLEKGIRCSDGTISNMYFYQIAECDRI